MCRIPCGGYQVHRFENSVPDWMSVLPDKHIPCGNLSHIAPRSPALILSLFPGYRRSDHGHSPGRLAPGRETVCASRQPETSAPRPVMRGWEETRSETGVGLCP
ncbi:hypothetical protein GJAV_G00107590 [Gymnothorax javanicus]|nr:hypothetical protein GJAV_G00107590 [Gymnothorax javanicus]